MTREPAFDVLPSSQAMTSKEFLNALVNGEVDVVQILLDVLTRTGTPYCVIDGLAVNAYAEPVVSLDLDIVIIADNLDTVANEFATMGWKVEGFANSVNVSTGKSDLRIQFQTDSRYQEFIDRASIKQSLGYEMRIAAPEDVVQGKVWAYEDPTRRKSKRQKDLADIARMSESDPSLLDRLPEPIRQLVE